MTTTTGGILDVDLLRFEQGTRAERQAVIDGVTRSLETGFVYVAHDLESEVIDRAYELLATFFHLPREEKDRYVVEGSMGQTGYTGLLVETAAQNATPDWKEMLNWGPEVPHGHPLQRRFPHRYMERTLPEPSVPGIEDALMQLYDRLFDIQRRFLRVIAVGIGADAGFFDGMLTDGPTLSRAIRYPPMTEAPDHDHIWAGEHGDINLITALPRATRRGLQVKVGEDWVDAIPPDGLAIINTGLMLERLTNGRIPTGVHRVIAGAGETDERYSVVQFCHPTPWTLLTPLACCIDEAHPQRESAIQAGDWLDQVLYDINLIEDARRVGDAS
ncbi:MAG: 2-oxoglutarate and iron-dependent oxygenase domain-containing protein [Planctomycetota bacterium]|nr:2-oxoglutarate and iron-dependent oxygenase domain-containing protein [Planctomycetota bacterium]